MAKTPITWIGLIKEHIAIEKAKGKKSVGVKDVMGDAREAWKTIKNGDHEKYIQGTPSKSSSKKTKKSKKSKKSKSTNDETDKDESDSDESATEPEPGHKGAKSKTRPGHIDFRTHKGDKYYNRDGHRQTSNRQGKKGRPYSSRKTKKNKGECNNCAALQKQIDAMQKEIDELKEKTVENEVL